MQPSKPDGPKPAGGPRPGGCMKKPKVFAEEDTGGGGGGGSVTIPEAEYKEIIAKLRSNELLGPAAADALEVAAGRLSKSDVGGSSPKADKLRKEVAANRNDDSAPEEVPEKEKPKEKKKKKGAGFMFAEQPEEIPEVEVAYAEPEPDETPPEEEKPEAPELNLTPKQNKMRTDLEMWLMDEVPGLFGVDDSEELAEELQEDGQAEKATELIAAGSTDSAKEIAESWLKDAPDEGKRDEFITELMEKVQAILDAGPKKKKKKKKDA
eukprot:TRINITY_DN3111_c0_g1_i1.p1 TRINITY_DN3111_c0_g1~~TRINITY_DN3111_c0_g1_i1.p1  ORF type:complete len:266 (+),score=103.90 TRINITY_DN3111_c0_g1_i1:84-881(+)